MSSIMLFYVVIKNGLLIIFTFRLLVDFLNSRRVVDSINLILLSDLPNHD